LFCSAGDVANPRESKYTLEYYLQLAEALEAHGMHSLAIKVSQMAMASAGWPPPPPPSPPPPPPPPLRPAPAAHPHRTPSRVRSARRTWPAC
jgi:hypothetical protein